MKIILSLIIGGALVVSGFGQTRNVLVGTNNAVTQPTNFWSADAVNARAGLGLGSAATNPASAFQPSSLALSNFSSGSFTIAISNGGTGATNASSARTALGLGTAATNPATAFQPSSVSLTNLATNNGSGLTNLTAANINGTVAIINGGSGATTAGGARTNLGLTWTGLTNPSASTFQTALFGANTNPVLVNTNGEVISPTNFWQVAPIATTFIESLPTANQTTNMPVGRNLHIHSLAISTVGVTNTIALPTTGVFDGDIALVVHQGPTSSVTAVRIAGETTNLITLNRFDEAVEFVYYNNIWQLNHNLSFIEPIYFSGTDAEANAAASRTNLGIPLPALTNTNNANFRTAIELGTANNVTFNSLAVSDAALTRTNLGLGNANNVTFSSVTTSGTLTATGVVTTITNVNVGGAINVTNKAETRTNIGLGGGITTNLVLKNSANNDTYMNFSNGILIYGSTTPP